MFPLILKGPRVAKTAILGRISRPKDEEVTGCWIKSHNEELYYLYSSNIIRSRSQWPRGLRHEMSSPAQTPGSWVRIPLDAQMSVSVYSIFVMSYLGNSLATSWSPVSGVLQTAYKIHSSRLILNRNRTESVIRQDIRRRINIIRNVLKMEAVRFPETPVNFTGSHRVTSLTVENLVSSVEKFKSVILYWHEIRLVP
jgi:hypothetical protein